MKLSCTERVPYISPIDREKLISIFTAAMNLYELDENQLINSGKNPSIVQLRKSIIYLVDKNTDISVPNIAKLFDKKHRGWIYQIIDEIELHKNLYRTTSEQLKLLINEANNFEKKYEWRLQLNN